MTMHLELVTNIAGSAPGSIRRGVVGEVLEDGLVRVTTGGESPLGVLCDVLQTPAQPSLELTPGQLVLVLLPVADDDLGCILGTPGPYQPRGAADPPDRVVVEAKGELVLKCGDSSLTMAGNGKILMKGVDIVTRAKRNHKIKAGTVAIN